MQHTLIEGIMKGLALQVAVAIVFTGGSLGYAQVPFSLSIATDDHGLGNRSGGCR